MYQWISAISAIGMLLLTGIYIYYTKKIEKANSELLNQNVKIHKENNMPNVIIYFDMKITQILEVIVENIGKNPAINTIVRFEPINEVVGIELSEKASIFKGISFLAPQQQIRIFAGSLIGMRNSKNEFPIYRVFVEFNGIDGEKYLHEYIIDSNMYDGNGIVQHNTVHDLTKELKSIKDIMSKMSKQKDTMN
ncbi:hypothetical protein [Cohnella terricola]|uniref:Uncharacterized protein n=1 Tax=Cohnella terricola TaxID=1289167 RepID=A0A559JGS6_9BACL|nr:hypothetical protein [Cohnella terricola]TVX99070.1 hypothetical protein FPZ45_14045 [Cohnella terricola]